MTPIRDLVAAIVARVLDTRRRAEDETECELAGTPSPPLGQCEAAPSANVPCVNHCSLPRTPRRHARHSPGAGVFSR